MTREHVDSLDEEHLRLLELVERFQSMIERLLPENARLNEALGNAVANNVIASAFITVGSGAIGYAAFFGVADLAVASESVPEVPACGNGDWLRTSSAGACPQFHRQRPENGDRHLAGSEPVPVFGQDGAFWNRLSVGAAALLLGVVSLVITAIRDRRAG